MTEKQLQYFSNIGPMDRMEMYEVMAKIYIMTCVHFHRFALGRFIKENSGPTIKGKFLHVARALVEDGFLLTEGNTQAKQYMWNMKKNGPISLDVAEAIIAAATEKKRKASRIHARNKYLQMKREFANEKN